MGPRQRMVRCHPLVIATVLGLFAVRALMLPHLGLFNDEAYYWEWSRRLAASYYDHPPMVAYVIALSTALLGWTQLGVHAPALMLSALTSFVLFRLTLLLFPEGTGTSATSERGRAFAWWTVLAFNTMPLFALGAVFTTPDAPCAFFWVVTVYLVRRSLDGPRWCWYLAGITAGLGFLSKYNLALLPPGVFLYLLLSRAHRGWLKRKEPYLALGLMLVFMLPVLRWNQVHQWASFSFHLVERHRGAFRPFLSSGRFLLAQQTVSPLLWAACMAGAVRSFRKARAGDDVHLFLLCCSFILAFFAVVSLFTLVNPNWFIFGFSTLLISGMDWLWSLRHRGWMRGAIGVGLALSLVFYAQAITLLLPISPVVDFATDLNGWTEVGNKLRQLRGTLPRPEESFVLARRFQLAALAAFYSGEGVEVTRMGGRRDQYDFWKHEIRGRDAIFFSDDQHPVDPREEYRFRRCEQAGEWKVIRHQRLYRTFTFWRCFDYQQAAENYG